MNFKELKLEDFTVGDIWLKKDGHKMQVHDVTSGSIAMKLFVHKSSINYLGRGEKDKDGNLIGGSFSTKFYFIQYFNFEDKITSKWSILEGFKKQP